MKAEEQRVVREDLEEPDQGPSLEYRLQALGGSAALVSPVDTWRTTATSEK